MSDLTGSGIEPGTSRADNYILDHYAKIKTNFVKASRLAVCGHEQINVLEIAYLKNRYIQRLCHSQQLVISGTFLCEVYCKDIICRRA